MLSDFDVFNGSGFCVQREREMSGEERLKLKKGFALHFLRIVRICWIIYGTAVVNLQRSVAHSVSKLKRLKKQQKSVVSPFGYW